MQPVPDPASPPPGQFPPGFRWGVAYAAHQVEGGNWNSDWWQLEHTPGAPCAEPSGDACDSWHRWPEDVAIAADLGFGDFRFSVEWARLEPEDGEWSYAARAHYRQMCKAIRQAGLDPVVTLHHFTLPRWVAADGGWENPKTVERFARYCRWVLEEIGPVAARICTVNEPNVVATMGWVMGMFPPFKQAPDRYDTVVEHLVTAHRAAVDASRAACPDVPVGLTLSMTDYQLVQGGEEKLAECRATEDVFLAATSGDDFLGVQCYTRMRIGPTGWAGTEPGVPILVMGYELWPDALEACIRRAVAVTGGTLPIVVTENGIGTDDDAQRVDYVQRALAGVQRCLADGLDVQGYTYWSLLDNFEWAMGYLPRFGLVSVDRQTFVRTPRRSARWLGDIARANALPA